MNHMEQANITVTFQMFVILDRVTDHPEWTSGNYLSPSSPILCQYR